ncbi:MAG TPA: peptidase M48 family protein [Prevotella sp.]|nr:peptidase M48 family protein [Prevotella sp.]
MKKFRLFLLSMASLLLVSACGTTETVPVTGRKHKVSSSYSDAQMLSLGTQEYTKFMSTAQKSTDAANTAMVQRVGQRLANAVTTYLKGHGYAADANSFQWEFNLVQNKEANAWCLPGGKIVVYEGLLPYTENETALAIVLGHEIAHAVAKHSAEQLTKQNNQSVLTKVIGTAGQMVGGTAGTIVQAGASVAGNYAFPLMNLKYSRSNESEADYMGLIFAAMAGYNPEEAIPFWKRMSSGSSNSSDFFSDHPSDEKRIAALEKEMPEAKKYYEAAVAAGNAAIKTTTKTTTKTATKSKGKKTTTKTTTRTSSKKRSASSRK